MNSFFSVISLISFVAFIVGMVNPENLKLKNRGIVALVCWSVFFISAALADAFDKDKGANVSTSQTSSVTSTNASPSEPEEQSNTSKSVENTTASIGSTVEVGNFQYRINDFKFKKSIGDSFMQETADGIFLLVYLDVVNVSSETRTLDGSLFNVTDTNGVKYEYSIDGSTALEMSGAKTLFLKQCQPKIPIRGVLVFEVPQKADYIIELAGGFWNSESVKVLLKK